MRKFRGGLEESSEDREFQSWAVVIRNVVSDAEGVEFVPHVSGSHGVFGGAPGFGEVKDALKRRVPAKQSRGGSEGGGASVSPRSQPFVCSGGPVESHIGPRTISGVGPP